MEGFYDATKPILTVQLVRELQPRRMEIIDVGAKITPSERLVSCAHGRSREYKNSSLRGPLGMLMKKLWRLAANCKDEWDGVGGNEPSLLNSSCRV